MANIEYFTGVQRNSLNTAIMSFGATKIIQAPSIDSTWVSPTIYNVILSAISPASAAYLSRTCHTVYNAVEDFRLNAFNVNRHFSHYFLDPIAFRSLQSRTGTLVSGPNALHFMDRIAPKNDISIYVNPGHVEQVGHHLVAKEGYRFIPEGRQNPESFTLEVQAEVVALTYTEHKQRASYIRQPVKDVYHFSRVEADGTSRHVHLTLSTTCAFHVIASFHSTSEMNVISYNMAVSLYPKATFEERYNQYLIYNSKGPVNAAIDNLEQDKHHAWEYRSYCPTIKATNWFMAGEDRYIGDRACWVVNLNTTGVQPRTRITPTSPLFTWDPLMENTWILENDGTYLYMKFCVISLELFRYCYTISHPRHVASIQDLHEDLAFLEDQIKARDSTHLTMYDAELNTLRHSFLLDDGILNFWSQNKSFRKRRAVSELSESSDSSSSSSDMSLIEHYPILVRSTKKGQSASDLLNLYMYGPHPPPSVSLHTKEGSSNARKRQRKRW